MSKPREIVVDVRVVEIQEEDGSGNHKMQERVTSHNLAENNTLFK